MVDSTTPAPERARLGAELEQLYAGGKFTEITGHWWMSACPKTGLATSSQARRNRMSCTTRLAFLAERMLEMNKPKQTEIKGFLGWPESCLGIIGGGPHARCNLLLRALRGFARDPVSCSGALLAPPRFDDQS